MAADRRPVLLVDDDADIREAVHDALADEGYETITMPGGEAALAYLRSHPPPALILLDWNMAPMNGPQVLAELAKDAVLSRIPVVVLTADARASENAAGSGSAGHVAKPVNLDTLFEIVGRYCGGAPAS